MHYTTYGDTNLRVSVAGLGAGGFSRLGLGTGGSQADAVAVVHAALDRGINLIDTAAAYGTEEVVGKAIGGLDRSQLVLATKAGFGRGPDRVPPETVIASLDRSLRLLGTDYIDIFQIHAVSPERYDWVHGELVPALLREKAKGKFRHLGITETPPFDPGHAMLQRAIPD
ncbi:MAG: aldo/keto reductase, partial [Pseudomonadales bacterium]